MRERGNNLVVFQAHVANRGVAGDLDAHHAAGQAAVSVQLGGALRHDLLVTLGVGQGGVAHDVDNFFVGLAVGLGFVRSRAEGAVTEAPAFDHAIEAIDHFADFHRTDDLNAAVRKIFRFLGIYRTDERGLNRTAHHVFFQGKIPHGGFAVDLQTEDALDQKAVGIEFGSTGGFEPLPRTGFLPNLGKWFGLFFGRLDSRERCGVEQGNRGAENNKAERGVIGGFHRPQIKTLKWLRK